MNIPGVRFQSDKNINTSLCLIDDLSPELKDIIRDQFSRVCHGPLKASTGKNIYSYKKTLNEFLKRYRDKYPSMKLGMIGELLCHILLFHFNSSFKPLSPYFNMEEASIKKGFDLLATKSDDISLWITEVKSGEVGTSEKDKKIKSLIDKARDDLVNRIGAGNSTLWHTAINNVQLAAAEGTSAKQILINALEDFLEDCEDAGNDLSTINAILVPILFENINNEVAFDIIAKRAQKISASKTFQSCSIFAIQKSTVTKVEKFLESEAA